MSCLVSPGDSRRSETLIEAGLEKTGEFGAVELCDEGLRLKHIWTFADTLLLLHVC